MSEQLKLLIRNLLRESNSDKTNLVPLLRQIRQVAGPITKPMVAFIASELNLHYSAVLDTASFYTFLDFNRTGKIAIRLAKTPISLMKGADELATAFEKALGVKMGGTSSDSQFSLSWTSDLGMSDQEPSALIEDWPLTRLSPNHVPEIIQLLRSGLPLSQHDHSRVDFGIQRKGPVLFSEHPPNEGLQKALLLAPENIIEEVTRSRLRGRGGAGFPTGLKWKSCRSFAARDRVVICNADEGEPGTFKDRVLLSEVPELLLEGMTIAAWAIGASIGIIYLRAEYAYLKPLLDKHLEERREKGLLGTRIHDKDFSFDIQIHMGAGAYICGEESALIESLEGKRGAPRDRPPYPTERGYLGLPTCVNNVETFACIPRILARGADWFSRIGTHDSTGTKLHSISGDCNKPGVYEVPFGATVKELLELADAPDVAAVQIGGPSGHLIGPKDFDRKIAFEDLPSGGSFMIFNSQRDLLQIVRGFSEFFKEESCGWCVPCRVGTALFPRLLDKILGQQGALADLHQLESLAGTVARTSRCGLGQTAPNPILDSLKNFRPLWDSQLTNLDFQPDFDLEKSLAEATQLRTDPRERISLL